MMNVKSLFVFSSLILLGSNLYAGNEIEEIEEFSFEGKKAPQVEDIEEFSSQSQVMMQKQPEVIIILSDDEFEETATGQSNPIEVNKIFFAGKENNSDSANSITPQGSSQVEKNGSPSPDVLILESVQRLSNQSDLRSRFKIKKITGIQGIQRKKWQEWSKKRTDLQLPKEPVDPRRLYKLRPGQNTQKKK